MSDRPRWPLAVALLGTFAVGAPFLFGQGVDAADDLVFHGILPWEWLRTAWLEGRSPWFVPGTVGGTNLVSDAVYLGPLYPATWSVLFLPVAVAYPLVCLLHALGAVLAVRWLARLVGASEISACLAGAAVGIGPVGAMGFVDGRSPQWPLVLWLPVAFACLEKVRSSEGRVQWRWAGAAGAAIALVMLGSHMRMAACAGAVLVLWAILGRLPLKPTLAAIGLGLAGGSPAVVPLLMDWGEASTQGQLSSLLAMMGGPAFNGIHWDNLPGLLVPSPRVMRPDYSLGVVLGTALIFGIGRGKLAWSTPVGRLVAVWGIVAVAVFLSSIPVLQYLATPLLFITHPVNEVYLVAVVPLAAATAAVAFDQVLKGNVSGSDPVGMRVVVGLVVAAGVLLVLPSDQITDGWTRGLYAVGWVTAAGALVAAWRLPAGRRTSGLFALAVVDLAVYALTLHLAAPSAPLELDRIADADFPQLADGYADFVDLGNMDEFVYVVTEGDEGTEYPFDGEFPPYREFVTMTQEILAARRVPLGYAAARGSRALAGEHKLTPVRQSIALRPLRSRLPTDAPPTDEDMRRILKTPEAARVLALHGLPWAVGPTAVEPVPGPLAPQCYSPASIEVEPDPHVRMRRLTATPFDAAGPALLESGAPAAGMARASVDCSQPGVITATAVGGRALVVVCERFGQGWRIADGAGRDLPIVPVNQVHQGVFVEEGSHTLTMSFHPPGLATSGAVAAGAWLLLLGLMLPSLETKDAVAPARPTEAPRWLLPAAALAVLVPGGPLLFGTGVDLPDDALFHAVPLYEWLHTALTEGRSPWFLPWKLGGVSLFADGSIHPLYPGTWLVLLLPGHVALIASMLLHGVGCLFAVRWMAQTFGASNATATLAGAGVAIGTVGSLSFVDLMIDSWPVFVWFPVALGALERMHQAPQEDRRTALRWAAVAAAATALLLLGSHLRYGPAAGAALAVWGLLRPGRRGLALAALALGLVGGGAGLVPALLEWRLTATDTARAATLAMPAHDMVSVWNLPGLFAPKPLRLRPDWSVGLVLVLAAVVMATQLKQRRLVAFGALLYAAGIAGGIPILRWLFAPLLLVTHPVDTFWGALAMIPLAVVGALALDRLLDGDFDALKARLRGPVGWAVAALGLAVIVRAIAAGSIFPSEIEEVGAAVAAVQAVVTVGVLVWGVRSPPGARRTALVCAVALVDVAVIAVRFHLAVPSAPMDLAERGNVDGIEGLDEGVLHLGELANLEAFLYDTGAMGPSADLADEGDDFDGLQERTQKHLLGWRWPVHVGARRGTRSASGRAKMPPRRPLALMAPLSEALVSDPVNRHQLEDFAPERIPPLFEGARSLGMQTMRLMRVRTAVGGLRPELRFDAGPPAPRCWPTTSVVVEPEETARIDRLLRTPFDITAPTVVEDPGFASARFVDAEVSCIDGAATVRTEGRALVVVGETWHPGWKVGDGRPTWPVNQVHFAFEAGPDDARALPIRFVPPGLVPAGIASAAAWLLIGLSLFVGRRR
ncbi:MAG: hypothetical protein GY898_25765 [Proteobacteria bacterium]|nr:hypothetical protein [Pseudomonadota bacterium]